MDKMKSLYQIITEKGADYEMESINSDHLVGMVNDEPRVIRAILERTAVVHPLNDSSPVAREVRRLEKVMVWPRDIIWQTRDKIFYPGFSRFHMQHGK